MIRIAICDDEPLMTTKIENLLLKISNKYGILMNIDVFFDGITLEKDILRDNSKYDLIYLDIEMKKLDGIKTAKSIRKIDKTVILIYVSSFEVYLKDLFEVEPFRFINKPVNPTIFEDYFKKAHDKIMDNEAYFEFSFNREVEKVLVSDIMYFESNKRTINIVTQDDMQKFYGKLNEVEKSLSNCKFSFLRIHQSFLVNYKFVKKISYNSTELTDGTLLQISEDRQKSIRQKYCNLIGREVID